MTDTQNGIVMPDKNAGSLFANMRPAHIGIRTTDLESLIRWYMEKLDFRLIKKFSNGDLHMAYLAPPNDDNFWIELLSGGIVGEAQTHRCRSFPDFNIFAWK